jgi:hypothetical protein
MPTTADSPRRNRPSQHDRSTRRAPTLAREFPAAPFVSISRISDGGILWRAPLISQASITTAAKCRQTSTSLGLDTPLGFRPGRPAAARRQRLRVLLHCRRRQQSLHLLEPGQAKRPRRAQRTVAVCGRQISRSERNHPLGGVRGTASPAICQCGSRTAASS